MGASLAVAWVMTPLFALRGWYQRRGYTLTDQKIPFPEPGENVGKPMHGAILGFARLEKQLTTEPLSNEIKVIDSSSLMQTEDQEQLLALATRLALVINWAYRGKYPKNDSTSWTSERQILLGQRTDPSNVLSRLQVANTQGPNDRIVFLASMEQEAPISNFSLLIGTLELERCEADS